MFPRETWARLCISRPCEPAPQHMSSAWFMQANLHRNLKVSSILPALLLLGSAARIDVQWLSRGTIADLEPLDSSPRRSGGVR